MRAVPRLHASYVLPLRLDANDAIDELSAYLQSIAEHIDEVVVVDGSEPHAVDIHRARFGPDVHLVTPRARTPNGKVGNVVEGVRVAAHDRVVIADDDVRYEVAQLERVCELLDNAEVVRPQNYFAPCPWHARFDTARTLLNRMTGGDWPGTLAVRRSALLRAGGYAGDVLFENLELVRTIEAFGGRELLALDLLVARRPPTTHHFRGQQVRQAYDEFARRERLIVSLLVLPAVVAVIARRRARMLPAAAAVVVAIAECGRRRADGRTVFDASSSFLAPVWLLWRSGCSWAALYERGRGGARYHGRRMRRAATPRDELRRRAARGHTTVTAR
jgi:hypothetical protein